MNISGKISQANGRLAIARLGISIQQIGDRLYLRGTFPPKPNSKKDFPYQQRIATKLPATPAGLKEAERQAREMGLRLITGEFEWVTAPKSERVGDLIEALGRSLLAQGLSETSWKKEYRSPLLKMADHPLDPEKVAPVLLSQTEPDTRTRKRWCLAIAKLLDYADIPNEVRRYKGNYSAKSVSPRDLPTDDQIWAAWRSLIKKDRYWGNAFGLMAVYGLRNHEVFGCDLKDYPVLWISRGKTGERYVYPLHPEWAEYVDFAIHYTKIVERLWFTAL